MQLKLKVVTYNLGCWRIPVPFCRVASAILRESISIKYSHKVWFKLRNANWMPSTYNTASEASTMTALAQVVTCFPWTPLAYIA